MPIDLGRPTRLTRDQARAVDRIAIERYRVPGIVLMENASRSAADEADRLLPGDDRPARVLVLCGGGNNGGDGLAVARHLHNRRRAVLVGLTADPDRYAGDALINWRIVQAMALHTFRVEAAELARVRVDLVVDAVFGTGLAAAPRDPFPALVSALDAIRAPILAIDLPSGLDCDTGRPLGASVRATRTVTFVAEKVGFDNPDARPYLGEVVVADIGCPREVLSEVTDGG